MKPKFLSAAKFDSMLNLGCDCGVHFLSTLEARVVKKICGTPKNKVPNEVGFL